MGDDEVTIWPGSHEMILEKLVQLGKRRAGSESIILFFADQGGILIDRNRTIRSGTQSISFAANLEPIGSS